MCFLGKKKELYLPRSERMHAFAPTCYVEVLTHLEKHDYPTFLFSQTNGEKKRGFPLVLLYG